MSGYQQATVSFVAAFAAIALLVGACTQPARPERMAAEAVSSSLPSDPPGIATLFLTVYGEDVGGFASHYYPLPREDYEAALLDSISRNKQFAASKTPDGADYDVNVGLISLVAPKWSGTVTLETTWSITAPKRGDEVARQMIRSEVPSPFGKVRDATEEAARKSIDSGLAWLQTTLQPTQAED